MSVILFLGLVSCIAALTHVPVTPDPKCIEYCPTGKFGQYICCDDHPGKCPPLRPKCPGLRNAFEPRFCDHDGNCAEHQKCCSDACLPPLKKVCKPAQF